jgi:hypothetical protein
MVQLFPSRVTRIDLLSPSEKVLLDADERPSLDEDAEAELLEEEPPDTRACALARMLPPSSTVVV